jgi:hypothetical protein
VTTYPWSDQTGLVAPRLDRPSRIMLTSAATWSIGILVAALTVPFYRGESTTGSTYAGVSGISTAVTTSSHATLVQVNGLRILIPVAIPLIAVASVAVMLSHRRRIQKAGPGPTAIAVLVVLGVGTLLAMLSMGVFVVPVDALLLAACIRASNLSAKPGTGDSWPK